MDHPRSRGVYGGDHHALFGGQGSSPLARGLPCFLLTHALTNGSSPLARGLRRWAILLPRSDGIIPARAGFTHIRERKRKNRKDHPRSRGVYAPPPSGWRGLSGSSPLARGLPTVIPAAPKSPGIIPARAGFTYIWPRFASTPADHPRSRGVYGPPPGRRVHRQGSSPLARGLPGSAGRRRRCCRIIPARAGFTSLQSDSPPETMDHPRSRGVYTQLLCQIETMVGSSPLARGLPSPPGSRPPRRRIIPARAGFTSLHPGSGGSGRDHPRSRGVYLNASVIAAHARGSSPLARGLPSTPLRAVTPRRIIPARARFTSSRVRSNRGIPDHPRSRGVYETTVCTASWMPGSSPLARGLLRFRRRVSGRRRIIPARAGFTVGS